MTARDTFVASLISITIFAAASAEEFVYKGRFLSLESAPFPERILSQIEKLEQQVLKAKSDSAKNTAQNKILRITENWKKSGDKTAIFLVEHEKGNVFIPAELDVGRKKIELQAGESFQLLLRTTPVQSKPKRSVGSGLTTGAQKMNKSFRFTKIPEPSDFAELVIVTSSSKSDYQIPGLSFNQSWTQDLDPDRKVIQVESVDWVGLKDFGGPQVVQTAAGPMVVGHGGGLRDTFHVAIKNTGEKVIRKCSVSCGLRDLNGTPYSYPSLDGIFEAWKPGEVRILEFFPPMDLAEENNVKAQLMLLSILF